ncbi:Acetylglutamate kinase [Capsicum annuum]|uniref:Acetylglutamate kinase n=1 Tax=Capsicum annuum TaxID=4072 RepID=A0A2G2YYB0_CAPAN|nr:Acetylglutamate kinase [Capsicum annuum]PHT74605.1 Acetylglutamate kinase [Capsicum annuum]
MKSRALQASVIADLVVLLSCVGMRIVFVMKVVLKSTNGLCTASLIDNYHIPVIASIVADKSGQSYNINADTTTGELAAALRDEKLILLTDVAGILEDRNDPGSLVSYCVRSMDQGVRTASIIDGRLEHYLLLEILTDEGAGIMITG